MDSITKIAIVTGGSRGLGRDMVLNLAKTGHQVLFTYHSNKTEAEKVQDEVLAMGQKAVALQLDVSDVRRFDRFVQEVSEQLKQMNGTARFDFLINNAGSGVYGSVFETTEDAFDSMINVHFIGVYILNPKMLPLMNDGGGSYV